MNQAARTTLLVILFALSVKINAQAPANDECANAVLLTSSTVCNNTAGNAANATASSGTSSCSGTIRYDVWYRFVAQSTNPTITLSSVGANFNNAKVDLYSGTCAGLTSLGCALTSYTASGLTINSTYYIRVLSTNNPVPTSNATFNICVTDPGPPPNDDCANATTLTLGTTNSSGTVWLATASSGIPVGCASGDPDDDVWYQFTATATNVSVVLSAVGTNLSTSGAMMQLFSGTCVTPTSVACAGTSTMYVTGLTISNTYYIRVYSSGTGSIGGTSSGSAFSITASVPSTPSSTIINSAGRMKEMFQQTVLSAVNLLNDPWEVTYGPDGYLWVTEGKGYKLYRIDPTTGVKITVLDITPGASGYLTSSEHTTFNCQFTTSQNPWPQGGFAGMALHPKFLDPVTPKNFVYVSYVRKYDSTSSTTNGGVYFRNNIVRFTYNTSTGKLESPFALCDTIPGSNDHNSQRLIIAPVSGVHFLFYGAGDMGAGQFGNQWRPMKAQNSAAYEGKILRFNLESDGEAGLDKWIPNDNPYNGATQSAVWATGIRNNQGFAYDSLSGILYGSSHGPYSDDEINIIQSAKNYGHPLVIGYSADGNYNTSTAGSPNTSSSCPMITNEVTAAAAISNYMDPLYSGYAHSQAIIHNIWLTNPSNGGWPSEGWSGLDVYTHTLIPGWKQSLIPSSLKWGRVLRLKLGAGGTSIVPTNGADTVSYFGSTNRYRDAAFAPNGKDMYVIMDKSSTTSGPSAGNPIVPACGGCLIKYTFLGYADASGKSSIPTAIDVTAGVANSCSVGTLVTIDNTNNNIWVPITGPDGNIMAEIHANGNNLGTITSSFYTNSGAIRIKNGTRYLDRNITITPQTQPSTAVKIRLYLTKAEFDALDADPLSGINSISDLKILKNSDACGSSINAATSLITPTFAEAFGSNAYMLQGSINSFSTFYFSSTNIILPVNLLTFTGTLQNKSTLLKWQTVNEINASNFVIERSADGIVFNSIGTVIANNITSTNNYLYTDVNAADLMMPVLYYRLKMVDVNGAYTYSRVIWVSFKSEFTVYQYPNPVHDILNLKLLSAKADNLQIQVSDMQGKIFYNQNKLVNNNLEIQVDCRKWPSQLYLIKVLSSNGQIISMEKVLKL